MAKKVKARTDVGIDVASFINRASESTAKKMSKKGIFTGKTVMQVIPVPAISTRYVLQNVGWPLGRMSIVSGPPKSYKSTFAREVGRWHIEYANGFVERAEVESKDNEALGSSIFQWKLDRVHDVSCGSVEAWQQHSNWYTDEVQKQMSTEDGPGRTVPICIIVDSISGKASLKTIESMQKLGHDSQRFATEAKFVTGFARIYPDKIVDWPFSWIGVNHVKFGQDARGNPVEYEPYGVGLTYQLAFDLRMRPAGKLKMKANYSEALLSFSTKWNSYGAVGKEILLPITFWQQEDGPGINRLYSRFEWWEASIQLLCNGVGMDKVSAAILLPKIKEIVDLHEKNCGNQGLMYWSNELGVPSSDPISCHDLGVLLETRPDVLTALYPVLGIQQQNFFAPGLDYLKQLEGCEHIVKQIEESQTRKELELKLMDGTSKSAGQMAPPPPPADFDQELLADLEEESVYDGSN